MVEGLKNRKRKCYKRIISMQMIKCLVRAVNKFLPYLLLLALKGWLCVQSHFAKDLCSLIASQIS